MLQETLGDDDLINQTLTSLKPNWIFYSLDVVGRSGVLAIRYNPRAIKVTTSSRGLEFLGMDIFSVDLSMNIWVINVYGPCHR